MRASLRICAGNERGIIRDNPAIGHGYFKEPTMSARRKRNTPKQSRNRTQMGPGTGGPSSGPAPVVGLAFAVAALAAGCLAVFCGQDAVAEFVGIVGPRLLAVLLSARQR